MSFLIEQSYKKATDLKAGGNALFHFFFQFTDLTIKSEYIKDKSK